MCRAAGWRWDSVLFIFPFGKIFPLIRWRLLESTYIQPKMWGWVVIKEKNF
jgi:hypothetical protein